MSDFTIKTATRQGVKPLICFYSESGCGKTYSSLLLARGYVGPSGRIGMIDSERGRGSLYADVIPGGYDVLQLEDPFSPQRYTQAISAIEQGEYSIGVLDSGSHEWEGIEGVLDMAASNEEKSGRPGLHNWKKPKLEHAKFVLRLMQSRIPWIICLRAKHKTRQGKDERGKTCIIKDDFTTPIQADDFIFEMTAHGEILQDHSFRLTKCSHPELRKCFPEAGPITVAHGEAIARWCAGHTSIETVAKTPPISDDPIKVAKGALWTALKDVRGPEKSWNAAEIWLVSQGIISDTESVSSMSAERLTEVTAAAKTKL